MIRTVPDKNTSNRSDTFPEGPRRTIIKALAYIPPQTKLFLCSSAYLLCLFTLNRTIFLAAHRSNYAGSSTLDILGAFLVGSRFDMHIISVTVGIAFLLLHIPGGWRANPLPVKVLYWLPSPVILLEFLVMGVDMHYYTDAGRHLSYEIYSIGNDAGSITSIVRQYYLSIIAFILFSAVFLAGWRLLYSIIREGAGNHNTRTEWLFFVILFLSLFIFIRGSISAMPIRTSHAFGSGKTELGHLALNGVYTVGNTLRMGDTKAPSFFDDDSAVSTVKGLLSTPGTVFLDDKYPILRRNAGYSKQSDKRPNVVILLLESWNGRYVGALGYEDGKTPKFDMLSKEGLLFTNFYSVGDRTNEAMISIGLGIPAFNISLNRGFILSGSLAQNRYLGLANILGERGYSSIFIEGAKKSSMGLDGLANIIGFDRILARDGIDLGSLGENPEHPWGIWDHLMAGVVNDELERLNQPFFALWLTLSPHRPLEVPDERFLVVPDGEENSDYLNTLYYADHSIGLFFETAKRSKYYDNTVFVLVADHPGVKVSSLTRFEKKLIPLLIIAPGILEPGVDDEVGGQLDILPTILDMLNIDSEHHAFGRSLLRPGKRFAFTDIGHGYGWYSGDNYITVDPEGMHPKSYNYRTGEEAHEAATPLSDLRSFLQTSLTLIRDNRLSGNRL